MLPRSNASLEHGVSNTGYWMLFAASQFAGIVVASLANVHRHPFPLIVAFILLVPGCLVEFVPRISKTVAMILIFPINFGAWYLARKILRLDSK
jgi:hypothetical protein